MYKNLFNFRPKTYEDKRIEIMFKRLHHMERRLESLRKKLIDIEFEFSLYNKAQMSTKTSVKKK